MKRAPGIMIIGVGSVLAIARIAGAALGGLFLSATEVDQPPAVAETQPAPPPENVREAEQAAPHPDDPADLTEDAAAGGETWRNGTADHQRDV